jgi:AraC-like DNA-binding protein
LRRLLRAKDRMDGASHEAWPVRRLARVSAVSEAHFARSFKQAFGVPPHRYLLTRRIERAKALLRDEKAAASLADEDNPRLSLNEQISTIRGFLIAGTAAMSCVPITAFGQVQTPMIHIVLLGDSIFDNAAYVAGGPDVVRQLRDTLPSGWRATLNAATMLGQSKTAFQAEIDAACELIDFFRFNVEFMTRVYKEQPISSPGVWNRLEYRPLEGFVFAVSPFNFTAIGGNLTTSAALMGNTVLWKPASTAALSAHYTLKLLQAAGLPDGVINLVYGRGSAVGDPALQSPDLAGIHFTGSTGVFQSMWKTIGQNIASW